MIYAFLNKLLSGVFLKFFSISLNTPLRYDYYESFTNPSICLNISHYYPSGPFYIFVLLFYERSTILHNIRLQTENLTYSFKRIDHECKSSILFSTMGDDLEILNVQIRIYLFIYDDPISFINYTFYKGFQPGYYELHDDYKKFSINLEIPDVTGNYPKTGIKLIDEEESYINSISGGNHELCIITENNNAAVLDPKYISKISLSYIYGINIKIEGRTMIIRSITLSAFECIMHKDYPKEPVIMVVDGIYYNATYEVLSWNYVDGIQKSLLSASKIFHPRYEYFYNLKIISPHYKKVIITNRELYEHICPDGSRPLVFYFRNGRKYLSILRKIEKISNGVEMYRNFIRDPQDPCLELNK